MKAAWLNGAPAPETLALHRGLHYGDGVFRTCLIFDSAVVELDRQLAKLAHDAARIDLELEDRAALEREASALAEGIPRGVLKILLLRGGGERGYRSDSRTADRLLCRYPLPQYPQAGQGIRAARANFKLATQTTLAGIKHLNRLEQVLATRHFPEGVDEIVLEDAHGAPVGGSRSNLFWVAGGVLCTPPVEHCGVAGLTRERILALAVREGIPARIAATSFDELGRAEELFFTNSLVGVWPAVSLDATRHAIGPVTRGLQALLQHPELG